jgi:hypothetical protein
MCCHLLSQTAFKILIHFFVHNPQGVEYTGHSILRIDYKYNLVAHDAQAASFKQFGIQILKYEKW